MYHWNWIRLGLTMTKLVTCSLLKAKAAKGIINRNNLFVCMTLSLQYLSHLDECPAETGGKSNMWRRLTLDGMLIKYYFVSVTPSLLYKIIVLKGLS